MSITGNSDDPIPHGLRGYRKPWNCECSICKAAGRKYNRDKQREYSQRRKQATDELAAKRQKRKPKSESSDSVPKGRRTIGRMERAVIEECATITDAKATLVVAAENLGRSVDELTGNPKVIALYNSTMKQLLATMAEMRGDKTKASASGRKKSGGRLATVGTLTKVRRSG